MNSITDITVLIAVIALALWPIVLFLLRFIHERRKRMEHLDQMTKDELDEISTKDLVINILKKIGRLLHRRRGREPLHHDMESVVGVH